MSSRCCSSRSVSSARSSDHAAQIVATLQQPLIVDGRVLTTSASVGASLYPDHAADAEGLLRAADVALFRAKELGRNRYALYSPGAVRRRRAALPPRAIAAPRDRER